MTFLLSIRTFFLSNWLLYACLGLVVLIQIWLLMQSKSISGKRLWIRLGLNLLVSLLVFLFMLQPEWEYSTDTNKILLTDTDVPTSYVQKIKDSLQIKETFSHLAFNRLIAKNPHFIDRLGHIYLLGQTFTPQTISRLSEKKLVWLPYFGNNQLQDLQWKGIVRKGDTQEVSGKIAVDEPRTLTVKYANQVLDSLALQKGFNIFRFSFPTFTIGRTETLLALDNEPLQEIHYYSQTPQVLNVLFILENPDFESKNLSEWLGKNNHRVEIITTIAKDAQSKVSINKTSQTKGFNPNLIITDPGNATNALVKKAVAEGKSVLFINCIAPEQDIKTINQALGTNWRIKKTSNEQFVTINENLTALPYHIESGINQKSVGNYPVAIQKKVGKIGLSLLNETFPLKLSGDSLNYNKIWTNVFQQLKPPSQDNISIESPIFADTQTPILLNNLSVTSNKVSINKDTAQLIQSAINPLSFSTNYIFRKTGWQTFQDSIQIFVEEKPNTLQHSKQMQESVLAHQIFESTNSLASTQTLTAVVPDWVWYLLIVLGFAALWLEPKLNF
ncbi:hypothetical protein [Emticicia agri]|uniref:Aerotolerance regulator N-terminal domain-containing protein n=1 Tax=Emticicia agri TaxID=2492393 RepID=A0A4Q5LUY4_9BACT|nr:hypothetical protein [Emticicia agri]RYU93329.1 hypothetical protein EWM59_22740 [Emticicia agri]